MEEKYVFSLFLNCQHVTEALHWIPKIFGVNIPVCMSQKLSNSLEIYTNVYILCEFSSIVFNIHYPISMYTKNYRGLHIYRHIEMFFNTLRPMDQNYLKSNLTWLLYVKFNEICIVTLMLDKIICLEIGAVPNLRVTEIHKSISIHYGLWRKIL